MTVPMFEEVDPASDCLCPGCRLARQTPSRPRPGRAHPAARRAVVVAAACAALGALPPAAAVAAPGQAPHREALPGDGESATPQGPRGPLYGRPGGPEKAPAEPIPATTRTDIIKRAKTWVDAKVPYSMTSFWSDGYRQDCSGYVSMAWGLPNNEWTGSLGQFGVKITKGELQPGDILLFHNPDNPEKGSHVVIFGGWTDDTHTTYTAYEQTPPHARRQATPYAYWSNSAKYVPYRYKGLPQGAAGAQAAGEAKTAVPYPGASFFGPGADNAYVTRLGRMLIARGAAAYYASGPGPVWGETDRRATQAFQRAQGWTGAEADGLPGRTTWELLVTGRGKDIGPSSHGVPGYPGRAFFRPGAVNDHVTRLGARLAQKGYGRFYAHGPGPHWGEADRRAVEAFQRAQGWRGGAADGYPGPETWRRLFA
ncbi:peptidoglycan-binding protein [Streptomyces nogalater]|uniref:Peptidoglycan-binding protein n=1 Tax=Streptomyces nogalater TaxID=38314 RepID=A0ABW0WT45_STRNO